MNKILSVIVLVIQLFSSFAILFCIYMIFALIDSDSGFENYFGLFIIQPIFAILISGITIFLCSLIGLPIRLNSKINNWLRNHFYVSLIGLLLGFVLIFLAFIPNLKENISYQTEDGEVLKEIPNILCSISGWFVVAFSFLHLYPPKQLTDKIQNLFKKSH